MMRLMLSDMRLHAGVWLGAALIAVACGYLGGWAVSIEATSRAYPNLTGLSAVVLLFSTVAAVAVLVPSAQLAVTAQRRSYALWQLANVRPLQVATVVLGQLFLVGALGAAVGACAAAATYAPLFPAVFCSYAPPADIELRVGFEMLPAVCLGTGAVFAVSGARAARLAARTSPVAALREPETRCVRMTPVRIACALAAAAGLAAAVCAMLPGDFDTIATTGLFLPLLVAVVVAACAPVLLPPLLRAWTACVPQRRGRVWYLARRSAHSALGESMSAETPVAVGVIVVAGIFSFIGAGTALVERLGITGLNTTLDFTSALLLLGGPVLLSALGATVAIVMGARDRVREVSLLLALGARPATLVASAVCEALIHAVTALLAGVLATVALDVPLCAVCGLPPFTGIALAEGAAVAVLGFAVVLVATLAPTVRALATPRARCHPSAL